MVESHLRAYDGKNIALEKRNVSSLALKKFKDDEDLTARGKLFHNTGPALLKERLPQECLVVRPSKKKKKNHTPRVNFISCV